ncbi:MAG TPA: hypothetical protein PKC28_10410 [Bdellovibrionales bacterium]|nr:hypothetical protein [Bdellovibrionales bacterium]
MRVLIFLLSLNVHAEILSTAVGTYRGGHVLTSRHVQMDQMVDAALNGAGKESLKLLALDSRAFAKATQSALLESVVALEAKGFNVVNVTAQEQKDAEKKVVSALKNNTGWKGLEPTPKEIEAILARKLQAKKFIQFRTQSSLLPVTELEAQKYFNENRLKFGNLPFENFKENIKSFLSRTQVDKRLKDWYDLLQNKYQVKSLIAEG